MAKTKDDLLIPLFRLISKYRRRCGCTPSAAIRDLLTDIMHVCRFEGGIDFDERVRSAKEVYEVEIENEISHLADDARAKIRRDTE